MSAQPGSFPSQVTQTEVERTDAAIYVHGAVSGLIGAATVALWFLYLDFSRGQVLYTPTVLGTVLFHGGEGLATLKPSIPISVLFTLVHATVFVLIGIAAARLLDLFEHRVNVILAVILLFVILGFAFLAFAMTFSASPLEVLSLPTVVFGNVLAAVTMVAHLFRARPGHDLPPPGPGSN